MTALPNLTHNDAHIPLEVSTLCVRCVGKPFVDLPPIQRVQLALSDEQSRSHGSKPIICLVPGFGGCSASYETLTTALRREGHRVVCINPTRTASGCKTTIGPWVLGMHAEKALDALYALKLDKVVVIGHSKGAAVATIMGSLDPVLVQRVIGLCPAGICKDSILTLLLRLRKKLRSELWRVKHISNTERALLAEGALAAARYYIKANVRLSLQEGLALARFSALKLREVRERTFKLYLIGGLFDVMFHPDRLTSSVNAAGLSGEIDVFTAWIGHDPQYDPTQTDEVIRVLEEHELLSTP